MRLLDGGEDIERSLWCDAHSNEPRTRHPSRGSPRAVRWSFRGFVRITVHGAPVGPAVPSTALPSLAANPRRPFVHAAKQVFNAHVQEGIEGRDAEAPRKKRKALTDASKRDLPAAVE